MPPYDGHGGKDTGRVEAYGRNDASDIPVPWALPNALPNSEVHSSRLNAFVGDIYGENPRFRINLLIGNTNALVLP
jgi:hypothetical protein